MIPTKAQAKEKKCNKKSKTTGEERKLKEKDCCVTFKPKNYL